MFGEDHDAKKEALDAIRKRLQESRVKKLGASGAPATAVEVSVTKAKPVTAADHDDGADGDKKLVGGAKPSEPVSAHEPADDTEPGKVASSPFGTIDKDPDKDGDDDSALVAEVLKHLGRYLPAKKA